MSNSVAAAALRDCVRSDAGIDHPDGSDLRLIDEISKPRDPREFAAGGAAPAVVLSPKATPVRNDERGGRVFQASSFA